MKKVLIIAEAGVNHNGSIETAKRLIDAAANAGVDYVKFQTFRADKLVSINVKKADYQCRNMSDLDISQYTMLKKLELSQEQHIELIAYCNDRGVKFLSTAFDLDSINFLSSLNLGLWKIPSGEITNYPYLKQIAIKHEPIILSTGMCNIEDIQNAVNVLYSFGIRKQQITILHCNTEYPTPMEDVNLKAMKAIGNEFGVRVGYSDHTLGIEIPIAAVALGAKVIEKHFTLDRNMNGPDHKASLEPNELIKMVEAIRNVEMALGSEIKTISKSEQENISVARKSIVAAVDINAGEVFSEANITVKRPGTGISPMFWDKLIGTIATKKYQPDDLIEL